ncbi:MAG: hypothetical protein U0326_18590 [Polyangiales bacterium]
MSATRAATDAPARSRRAHHTSHGVAMNDARFIAMSTRDAKVSLKPAASAAHAGMYCATGKYDASGQCPHAPRAKHSRAARAPRSSVTVSPSTSGC